MVHHRTGRRNSSHNQSREFSLCVPRDSFICHYLVIGSLHKLSVCVLIRLLAFPFGCGLLCSHRPRCQTLFSRQRIAVYVISVEHLFALWCLVASEQLFFLLIGKNISTKGCSLSVRCHKVFNVSRHHIKVAFLFAIIHLTLRQSCVCQLQGYNIGTSLKCAFNAPEVGIMSLYHLGDIATDVHTPTFHRYLEHLGRNALQTTHIIQASSNSTANATHSSPACALRKTAHSHKLHGIANRGIITR